MGKTYRAATSKHSKTQTKQKHYQHKSVRTNNNNLGLNINEETHEKKYRGQFQVSRYSTFEPHNSSKYITNNTMNELCIYDFMEYIFTMDKNDNVIYIDNKWNKDYGDIYINLTEIIDYCKEKKIIPKIHINKDMVPNDNYLFPKVLNYNDLIIFYKQLKRRTKLGYYTGHKRYKHIDYI